MRGSSQGGRPERVTTAALHAAGRSRTAPPIGVLQVAAFAARQGCRERRIEQHGACIATRQHRARGHGSRRCVAGPWRTCRAHCRAPYRVRCCAGLCWNLRLPMPSILPSALNQTQTYTPVCRIQPSRLLLRGNQRMFDPAYRNAGGDSSSTVRPAQSSEDALARARCCASLTPAAAAA